MAEVQRMRDVSQDSGSLLRAMIDASPLAIVAIDATGAVTMWNPAAQRIFGWNETEVLSRPVPFVPDEDQEDFRELRERVLSGEVVEGVELHRRRKDGRMIDVSVWAAPIRDTADRIGGILALFEDITQRRKAEEALLCRTIQIEAVRHVSAEIVRELNLGKVLALIHQRAMELVGADGGSLFLWDEATRRLIPQVWYGIPDGVGALTLGVDEGVCGVVAERCEGLIVNDYRAFRHAHPRFLAETTISAVLAEPLRVHDRLVGVIAVNHQEDGRSFTTEDQQFLAFFAAQAAIAIENARLYQDTERERREIELVADLSQRLNASLDLDTVLQRVVGGARDLTGSDLAQIALRDDHSDALVFRYRAGSHSTRLDTHRIEAGKGIGGRVMVTGRPFRTANYAADPRITKDYLADTLAEDVVAELAVPIQTGGRVEGVLFVDNRSPRPFTARDEQTLLRLADHAATAMGNARLHSTAIRRAQQLATLNTVARALTTELDPRDVAQGILKAVQVLIPGAVGRLLEQVEGMETLRVVASIGLHRGHTSALRVGEGLAAVAASTRQPVACADVARDPRFVNRAWAASEGLVSGIVLPLVYGDRVNGILSVFLRHSHVFTDEQVELLRAFAAQGAIALENARLFEQVRIGREHLLDLTQRVVSVQEAERSHLSRELHDEASQALTAIRIGLGLALDDLPANAASLRQRLGETVALVDSITDRLRFLAQSLRPPALETLGLHVTLEGLCRSFGQRTGLRIDYTGKNLPCVPADVSIHLYRVVQEALTNVSKHARAGRVQIALEYDGDLISVLVEDDGVGFDATTQFGVAIRSGIGLIGMRERLDLLKGRLDITSQPGCGTRLVARVPWKDPS